MYDAWQDLTDHRALGTVTARWLRGQVRSHPAQWGEGPDAETGHLIGVLSAINEAGFATTGSQPGVHFDGTWAQRAFAEGLCDQPMATRIELALAHTGLVTLVIPPRASVHASIPVTTQDGTPCTFLGRFDTVEMAHLYAPAAGPVTANLVADSWCVQVFDPVWGRDDLLWPSLLRAVRG